MTSDIHFVKNNPFILNDFRYTTTNNNNVRLPTSASSIHIPSNNNFHRSSQNFSQTGSVVSQSASCSNIQKTVGVTANNNIRQFEAPPIPHSVFRRFRLVSEDPMREAAPPQHSSMEGMQEKEKIHSASISSIVAPTMALINEGQSEKGWYNRGRLEHSQSHGAISHFQQPLKLQVDSEYVSNNINNNNNNGSEEDEEGGKNCESFFCGNFWG